MFEYVVQQLREIEDKLPSTPSRQEVLHSLQALPLTEFGLFLFSLPDSNFPKMSSALPRMASEEVQKSWTGAAGAPLLKQSLDFVRCLSYDYSRITGSPLNGRKILDFGCGYGRISRLMYYFTDEENLTGVDPWARSIEICFEAGLDKNFYISDYLPTALPVSDTKFDVIIAFSVFTHLSKRATITCLNTITNYLAPKGVIIITVRPIEYWNIDRHANELGTVSRLKQSHQETGFAFSPHNGAPVDGEITYGDTSMTFEWVRQNFPNLRIASIDRSLNDPYQIYVYLQKA